MANPDIRLIPLNSVLLNTANPRFDPRNSQSGILEAIVQDQGDKLVKLAEDIAANGLNPSELLLVTEDNEAGQYIVLEGNRRIAAIQLATSLELIDSVNSLSTAQSKRFKALVAHKNPNLPKRIRCVVVPSERIEEARYWIQLKHTGENGGVGVVSWDHLQQQRFLSQDRSKPLHVQLFEFVKNGPYLDEETKQKPRIALTTIQRILQAKGALKLLGIDFRNDQLIVPDDPVVLERLAMLVTDVASGYINVRDVYLVGEKIDYLEELIARQHAKTTEQSDSGETQAEESSAENENGDKSDSESTHDSQSTSDDSTTGSQTEQQERRVNPKRKTLIPEDFVVHIPQPRINNIYHELQRLDLDKFTNSGAVMLRVFIELSVDEYAEQNGIETDTPIMKDGKPMMNRDGSPKMRYIQFSTKVARVADYMEAHECNRQKLKGIRMLLAEKDHILSVDSLHSYVHNKHVNPDAASLKANWNSIDEFVRQLWA